MGRIRKNIENLVRKVAITALSIPLTILPYGCKPDKNYAPKANLEVSPKSGNSPLDVSIKLTGSDDNGVDDITNYILYVDNKKIRNANYPLDTIIKFKNNGQGEITHNIYGEVTDSENNTNKEYEIVKVRPAKINRFVQPNDSTLDWLGSGDINNDNVVNSQDLTKMDEVINGNYSNPNDRRLKDRADVNGDGIVNNQDKQLLENKLNGVITYLPGYWNELDYNQRKDWFLKMLKIDKTNEIPATSEFDCDEHSYQLMMNFNGFKSDDLKKFLEVNKAYDTLNNCRFNIPADFVAIYFYKSNGEMISPGHAINTVVLGNNALNFEDRYNFSSETDAKIDIGKDYKPVDNEKVWIQGIPVLSAWADGKKYVALTDYIYYTINSNGIPNLELVNPEIDLITERGK
jgi:hypothetical protein